MSLSYTKLEPVSCPIPQLNFDGNNKYYSVLKGAKQNYYKKWISTSVSNSNITFSMPPNSNQTVIDRRMYVKVPFIITFMGTATDKDQYLLNMNGDAPRQYPFSSCVDTTNLSINQTSIGASVGELIHPLSKFNTDEELENGFASMGCSYPDQATSYAALNGAVRNPLAGYGDSTNHNVCGRGAGSNWTVISNPKSAVAGEVLTAVVHLVTVEPIYLIAPLLSGKNEYMGLSHVSSMDLTFNMLNSQQRIWSRAENTVAMPVVPLSFLTYQIVPNSLMADKPTVLALYYTMQDNMVIPRDGSLLYPYYNMMRFVTDSQTAIAANTSVDLSSSAIQLPSIPKKMYVFVRERNQDLYANATSCDSFFSINSINVTYQNQTGLFSSASQEQLYAISKRNRCNLSWEQWSGKHLYNGTLLGKSVAGIGSVFCAEFGYDIPLDSALDAPGKANVNSNLQIQINVKNQSNRLIVPSLYVVIVYDGVWNVSNNQATTQTALLTSEDILNSQRKPGVDYKDIDPVYGDGIFSDIGDAFKSALGWLKDNKVISTVARGLSAVPGPIGEIARPIGEMAASLGYGGGLIQQYGGVEGYGGQNMDRKELRSSARKRIVV